MMPTTLTLAAMASLLLLVHGVKQLRKAPSHTENRLRSAALAWGA
jgi:hypothetical protein